jgi:hypothetical protein
MPLAVNDRSADVLALAEHWPVCEALMGGTPAMRKAGTAHLPKWPGETDAAYRDRLNTATLFPAYRRTVSVMAGKPFAKALTLDEADSRIVNWCEDVDRGGVNLHAFAAAMFEESFFGLAGVLVDYPDTRPRDAEGRPLSPDAAAKLPPRTVAQVESTGARPYFVRVLHNQILGWQAAMTPKGVRLSQLRLKESREEADGPYGTKTIPQVRVLYPGRWELHEQRGDVFVQVDAGTTSLDEIPFVPVYGRREAFMLGTPTLLDLAHLNVKHWQSQSDQDTILHVSRVPILVVKGVEAFALTLGASTAVNLGADPNADMKFVEHSGASIDAGEASLRALEVQMVQTGAELLVKQPGDRTATESAGDQEGNKCDLQRLTEQFEDALDQALVFMAQFAGIDPNRAGNVALFKDFGAATLSDASATLVADLNARGLLTKETTLREMQRRGVIEASVDVEEEIAKAAEEGPALGELSDGMPPAAPVAPKKTTKITRDADGNLIAEEQ